MNYSNNNQPNKKDALADYVTVNERIIKFYEKYPDGRIETELLKWENGVVLMKAIVFRNFEDTKPLAIGHAYEKEDSSFINKTSAVENCETSAVGRALAVAGLEIKKSIASKEEVANAIHQQEKIKESEENNYTITEKQVNLLYYVGKKKGLDSDYINKMANSYFNKTLKELLKLEFDKILEKLNSLKDA